MNRYILVFALLFILLGCSKKTYTVTFSDEDKIIHTQEILENQKAKEIDEIYKEGYTFLGWYDGDSKFEFTKTITKNLDLIAKWGINTYTITFLDDDGEILKTEVLEYNQTITPPATPTKDSVGNKIYTFIGWDQEFDKAKSDMYIYAQYEVTYNYTVTFYNYDKSVLEKIVLQEGSKVEYLDYTRDNDIKYTYTFIGWFLDLNDTEPYDFNRPITKNINLYPKFSMEKNIIDFTNMKVSFLGDSITTFYSPTSPINSYYSGENQFYYPLYSQTVKKVEDTWWYKLTSLANLQLGINNSWSGSSCYNFGSETNSGAMNNHRIATLGEAGTPDIIIINIGTNDNVNSISDYHFRNAYSTMIDRILKAYPNALIFCSTLGYSAYTGYGYIESRRLAYNNIIREVASLKDQYIIEIDKIQTQETYKDLLGDSLHPNAYGMSLYAQKAYETLLKELKQENPTN